MIRKIMMLIVVVVNLLSCKKNEPEPMNYRQEMRNFIIGISQYSRSFNSDFIIIPQNGIELILNNPQTTGDLNLPYLEAIDGNGQEELYYGYYVDDMPTPASITNYWNSFLVQAATAGKSVLVTDYCFSLDKMIDSYNRNNTHSYISFASDSRELDGIPYFPKQPFKSNNTDIKQLSQAKNFLYLINTERFSSKEEFIDSIAKTDFDLVILDLFFQVGTSFAVNEISQIKFKANGGERMLIAYMSIGEAEEYRYYWQPAWDTTPPEWLGEENPYWPGNYSVKYWYADWQEIIYGNQNSYAKKVIDAGFDGLYLDLVDTYERYE